jgi:tetratricopeptide (TPR) repeat protein
MQQAERAIAYYEQKEYLKAATAFDSLFSITNGSGLVIDKYNAACCWALAGNRDKAFGYLNKIGAEDAYANADQLMHDPDLDLLHADKRWQGLVRSVQQNKQKADAKLDKPLANMLDSIYLTDKIDRLMLDSIQNTFGLQSSQMDSLWKKINQQDSINLVAVKSILDSRGWPGPEEVGQQGAMALFLVIQHADSATQVYYLPMMRDAVKHGKAAPQDLALLEDRVLTRKGEKQVYGSQVRTNPQTGLNEFFPIADEANVNKRRELVGLQPIEAYATNFAIRYVPATNASGN